MQRPVVAYQAVLAEKRVHTLKISVGETLYRTLQDLAARRDRSLSDYCQHRLLLDSQNQSILLAMLSNAENNIENIERLMRGSSHKHKQIAAPLPAIAA